MQKPEQCQEVNNIIPCRVYYLVLLVLNIQTAQKALYTGFGMFLSIVIWLHVSGGQESIIGNCLVLRFFPLLTFHGKNMRNFVFIVMLF